MIRAKMLDPRFMNGPVLSVGFGWHLPLYWDRPAMFPTPSLPGLYTSRYCCEYLLDTALPGFTLTRPKNFGLGLRVCTR